MLEEKLKSDDPNMQIIAKYLIDKAKESPKFNEIMEKTERKYDDCYHYIYEEARKLATNGVAAVKDSTVYEWAEKFYTMSDEEFKKLHDKKPEKPKEEKKDQKAKKTKEPVPDVEPVQEKAPEPKKTAEPEPVETVEKPKKEKKTKTDDLQGQLDLFSFLGDGE